MNIFRCVLLQWLVLTLRLAINGIEADGDNRNSTYHSWTAKLARGYFIEGSCAAYLDVRAAKSVCDVWKRKG